MRLLFKIVALALAGCLSGACSGSHDDLADDDVQDVRIEVRVNYAFEDLPEEASKALARTEEGELKQRFVLEARRGSTVYRRREVYVAPRVHFKAVDFHHVDTMRLKRLDYTVAVWSDFAICGEDTTRFFDVADLSYISETGSRTDDPDIRQCFSGVADVDLRRIVAEERRRPLIVALNPVRPQGKISFVATDADEFLARHPRAAYGGYMVRLEYGSYPPAAFNVVDKDVCGQAPTIVRTMPLPLDAVGADGSAEIGCDYVIAYDKRAELPVRITVLDEASIPVASTDWLKIPFQRGKLSTVKGDFLSSETSGSVKIEAGWGDIVYIDLTK